MERTRFVVGLRLFAAAALWICLPHGASAQSVGAIAGTVQDESGAVIPGATVVLSNPGVIGGNQEVVTDERGGFQFTRLVPSGTYSVRAQLSGFRAAVRENVNVNADVTSRVDLTLRTGELAETITVSGQAPLLDTASTSTQTVLERSTLEALPTSNDIWSIARMVPSVVMSRYDVGGSQSLQQFPSTVHGAKPQDNTYLFDGLDTSNPSGGTTTATYFDVAMFQEVNYITGNAGAEQQKGGLIYNLVTKTGSNGYHGWLLFPYTNSHLNADNLTPELTRDLLAGVPAKVLQVNPNFEPRVQLLRYHDLSFGLSGPIMKDKLWFVASGEFKVLDRYRVGQYNADGTQGLDDNYQRNYSFKASWQASPRNQVHYIRQWNQRVSLHRLAGDGLYESRAMPMQDLRDPLDQVRWSGTLSNRLLADVMASRFYPYVPRSAQPEVKPGDLPKFDLVTRTYMVAQGVYNLRPEYPKYYGTASLTYSLPAHDLKFGYQFDRGWNQTDSVSMSHYPSGLLALYRNGVPDSVNTYNTPNIVRSYNQDHGFYVQDKWTASRKLTLNMGLRLQKSYGWVPAVCQVQTIFIQTRCFDRIDGVPDWLDPAPRFGLVYDVSGDGKTAIKLSANRYYLVFGVSYGARVNPMRTTNDTRSWTDRNGDLIPQLDELGPSTGFNLGSTSRYADNVKRPLVNDYSVEIQRQMLGDLVVSFAYTHRETRRDIGSKNLAVPPDAYTPITVTEKNSGQTVTVYNQSTATRGLFDVVFDNFPELDAHYNGVDITANKRISNHWMVIGGLSYGRNVGDIYGTGDLRNPNFTFRRGVIDFDVPWSFKASAVYELPRGFRVSGNVQHFTGFPEQDSVTVGSNTVALTQVTQSILVAPRGTNRLPSVNTADLALKRLFRLGGQLTAEPAVQLFNVTNANTVQNRLTVLGPTYHRALDILQGRMWRFDVNVKF